MHEDEPTRLLDSLRAQLSQVELLRPYQFELGKGSDVTDLRCNLELVVIEAATRRVRSFDFVSAEFVRQLLARMESADEIERRIVAAGPQVIWVAQIDAAHVCAGLCDYLRRYGYPAV